jgi:hypothetical protein
MNARAPFSVYPPMAIPNLLHCPFCGSNALENLDGAALGQSVRCIECECVGPKMGDGDQDGFDSWNRRVPVPDWGSQPKKPG